MLLLLHTKYIFNTNLSKICRASMTCLCVVAFCSASRARVQLNSGHAARKEARSRAVGRSASGATAGAADSSLAPPECAHHQRTRIPARHSSSARSHSTLRKSNTGKLCDNIINK